MDGQAWNVGVLEQNTSRFLLRVDMAGLETNEGQEIEAALKAALNEPRRRRVQTV